MQKWERICSFVEKRIESWSTPSLLQWNSRHRTSSDIANNMDLIWNTEPRTSSGARWFLEPWRWLRISTSNRNYTSQDLCTTSAKFSKLVVDSLASWRICCSSKLLEKSSPLIENIETNACGIDWISKRTSWWLIIMSKEKAERVKHWTAKPNHCWSRTSRKYSTQNESKMQDQSRANLIF